MAAPREKRLEIADRRRKVAALYLRRQRQEDIATSLGVSQPTVCADIKAILAEYRRERIDHIDREVAELDEMERDCAVEFHEAKKKEKGPAGVFQGSKAREWMSERREIKKRRASMLGLDAPARAENTVNVNADTSTVEELKRQLARLAAEFAARDVSGEPDP